MPRSRSRREHPQQDQADTFQQLLAARLTPTETSASRAVESLAHLDYERELVLKNESICALWQHHGLAGRPDPVLPSPRPRRYRTTTRRRAHYRSGRLQLGFCESSSSSSALPESLLEPEAHTAIYRWLVEELSAPNYRAVATHLNHAIIRGSYEAFSVILNLDVLNGSIVRRSKSLGNRLQSLPQPILSAFLFCDPSRSDFYFEHQAPPVPVRLKRLFGPARFPLRLGDRRYKLPPTSFTQVNESMIGPMLAAVRTLLQPEPGDRLLDLYCGYGLFAHDLGDTCAEVFGIDVDRDAIETAIDHVHHNRSKGRVSFTRRDISARSLAEYLPAPGKRELVVLDPPRRGTDQGVVDCLASRGPLRVVHIFCGVSAIPDAVSSWKQCGYGVTRCLPLDMFAGTPNLETLLLLEPIG